MPLLILLMAVSSSNCVATKNTELINFIYSNTCHAEDIAIETGVTSFADLFRDNTNFNGNVGHWGKITASINRFDGMFAFATNYQGTGLKSWGGIGASILGNPTVTNYTNMFEGTVALCEDLSGWFPMHHGSWELELIIKQMNFSTQFPDGCKPGNSGICPPCYFPPGSTPTQPPTDFRKETGESFNCDAFEYQNSAVCIDANHFSTAEACQYTLNATFGPNFTHHTNSQTPQLHYCRKQCNTYWDPLTCFEAVEAWITKSVQPAIAWVDDVSDNAQFPDVYMNFAISDNCYNRRVFTADVLKMSCEQGYRMHSSYTPLQAASESQPQDELEFESVPLYENPCDTINCILNVQIFYDVSTSTTKPSSDTKDDSNEELGIVLITLGSVLLLSGAIVCVRRHHGPQSGDISETAAFLLW